MPFVSAANEVADVDLAQAKPSGNGRHDLRERQLKSRVAHLRVVGLDRPLNLFDHRFLRRELLPGDELALEQGPELPEVVAGVRQAGLILRSLPLRLREGHLVRARVDFGEDLTCLHLLTFVEEHANEFGRPVGCARSGY
jgi:hypothetical protein